MARYLKIKGWSEFQHYKDRNPPWIKLHRTLLDDYEFSCLHDASKAHLMLIWLFASQQDGAIPDDPKFLMKKLGLESEPNLKLFIDHGFLIVEQDASNAIAPAASEVRLETEAYKEETYKEEKKGAKKSRATILPADFSISDRVRTWAASKGHESLDRYLEFFTGRMKANGKTYVDWDEAFMNCIREDWPELRKRGNGQDHPEVVNCSKCGGSLAGGWTNSSDGRLCNPCWEAR